MVCDEDKTSSDNWEEFIKHRKNVLLEGVEVFNDFFVITERENGQRRFNVISNKDGEIDLKLPLRSKNKFKINN